MSPICCIFLMHTNKWLIDDVNTLVKELYQLVGGFQSTVDTQSVIEAYKM